MRRSTYLSLLLLLLTSAPTVAQEPTDGVRTIQGVVQEVRSGTPDVPVFLFDAASGLPVAKGTYKVLEGGNGGPGDYASGMAVATTDADGRFRFENVPDGEYRVAAQRWTGPYKGPFELHGGVIQLLGSAEVSVPRPAEEHKALVSLRPPGQGVVRFDQRVGNDATLMLLSTSPPEFDAALGPHAMGKSFLRNLIGVNRMPSGVTTVVGVPPQPVYAFFFAPDNSPGFAAVRVDPHPSGYVAVPEVPFVAGWSDGRKTPPPELADLAKHLEHYSLTVTGLLEIPELSSANHEAYRTRIDQLTGELSRELSLPGGRTARVGDLLALDTYRRLQGE